MAKNMPVPNTRILNVPKTTGTQNSSLPQNADSAASCTTRGPGKEKRTTAVRTTKSTSLIPKSVRSRQAISSCALGSEEHLRTASRHTQRGERHTPKDRRILPLSIIQIVEWFDLYVFGFDLYVFSGFLRLKTCFGCDLLSQIQAIGASKAPR